MISVDRCRTLDARRDASQEENQKVHRRLAGKLHPDLDPGNREAEKDFKEVSAAYDPLSAPGKHARFDRGEIDDWGTQQPHHRYYRNFSHPASHAYATDAGLADSPAPKTPCRSCSAADDHFRTQGAGLRYQLTIDFLTAINGASKCTSAMTAAFRQGLRQ